MNLVYKTLLEIKLLNEFFLTREDGTTLLNEPDPVKRQALLEQAFVNDRETMNRDIDFDFPLSLKPLYENYGLKVLPSYAGCKLVIRVNKKILPDQSLVFEPFTALPASLGIFINMIRKNNLPDIYSNTRINRSVPATYLFSNENIPDPKTFPFLVNTVSSFAAGSRYEQGELAIDSASKLQETYYDKNGNATLFEVKTAVKKYANENDRMLLPLQFNFRVINDNPVTQATITVKDHLGAVVKTFTFNQADPIDKVWLDLTDKADLLQLSGLSLPNAICTLSATGNNGYAETKQVVFDNKLYSAGNWGLIHIKPAVTNTAFNLLANDGFIKKRRDSLGVWTEAPVVEIPVKSRLGHFRYINSKGKRLDLPAALNTFLNNENGVLISLMPVSLAHYYFMVPDDTATTTKYLPNPVMYDMKKDARQRIYFDVFVPESDLFPVVP